LPSQGPGRSRYWLLKIGLMPETIVLVTHQPLPLVFLMHRLHSKHSLSSFVFRLSSFVFRLSSFVFRLSVFCLSSFLFSLQAFRLFSPEFRLQAFVSSLVPMTQTLSTCPRATRLMRPAKLQTITSCRISSGCFLPFYITVIMPGRYS